MRLWRKTDELDMSIRDDRRLALYRARVLATVVHRATTAEHQRKAFAVESYRIGRAVWEATGGFPTT